MTDKKCEELLSKAKPILFNTEMVRAILDGRKTQTRRVLKQQPKSRLSYICMGHGCGKWGYPGKDAWKSWKDESFRVPGNLTQEELSKKWTPPCHTGDILYVRETWQDLGNHYVYKADEENVQKEHYTFLVRSWCPSIHMPKETARLFLRVTNVSVAKLQDISGYSILAEGVDNGNSNPIMGKRWENMQRMAFSELWDSIIKKSDLDKYGWETNPWVFVISFERMVIE